MITKPSSAILYAVLAGLLLIYSPAAGKDYPPVVPLLKDSKTILGQPLSYPTEGQAHVQSVIVTMQPGEETGLHTHPHPTFGYVLEGELTVSYPDNVTKTYKQGQAVMEAVNTPHNGRNTGTGLLRILVVFMGVEDTPNSKVLKEN